MYAVETLMKSTVDSNDVVGTWVPTCSFDREKDAIDFILDKLDELVYQHDLNNPDKSVDFLVSYIARKYRVSCYG